MKLRHQPARSKETVSPNPTARPAGKSQPNPEEKQVPAESKAATPIRKDVPVSKRDFQVPPVTPILATRPKRVIRPSLKVRENQGLAS